MPLLPSKNNTKEFDQSAVAVLTDLKKGGNDKRNEFIWVHQERIYAVALLGTGDHEHALKALLKDEMVTSAACSWSPVPSKATA